MRRLWTVLVVGFSLLLVGAGPVVAQPRRRESDAEQTGRGFADMLDGATDWLAGFARDPENGKYLGYLILLVLGVWLARRIGIMRS